MKKVSLVFSSLTLAALMIATFFVGGTIVMAQTGPSSSFDVKLTKTLLTMPGNGFFVNDDVPLIGARWFDGYFAVTSACSGNNNSKGLWIFKEDGSRVDSLLNTCRDTGEGTGGSSAHTWSTVPNVQPVTGGQFIKEMGPYNERPPLVYKVTDNNARFISRPWKSSFGGGNGERTAQNMAAVRGYAVLLELQTGDSNAELKNVLYRIPDWDDVDEMDAAFIPLTGVGRYIVGTPTPGNSGLVLYKVSDNEFDLVDSVATAVRPVAFAVDPSSLNDDGGRVGFFFSTVGAANRNTVAIYDVNGDGLTLARTVNLPDTAVYTHNGSLAISGDYTAFTDCGLPAAPAPSSGASDNASARTCGVGVMKGNTRLSVERLPSATTVGANSQNASVSVYQPLPQGLAISKDGKDLLAVTTYGAYLYDIGTASTTTTGTATTTPNPQLGVGFNGLGDVLSFANSYLQVLERVMGGSAIQPGTKIGGDTGTTSPQIKSAFDELIKILDSN